MRRWSSRSPPNRESLAVERDRVILPVRGAVYRFHTETSSTIHPRSLIRVMAKMHAYATTFERGLQITTPSAIHSASSRGFVVTVVVFLCPWCGGHGRFQEQRQGRRARHQRIEAARTDTWASLHQSSTRHSSPASRPDERPDCPLPTGETEEERQRIRSSNDQELERQGKESRRNHGCDEAADGIPAPEIERVVDELAAGDRGAVLEEPGATMSAGSLNNSQRIRSTSSRPPIPPPATGPPS